MNNRLTSAHAGINALGKFFIEVDLSAHCPEGDSIHRLDLRQARMLRKQLSVALKNAKDPNFVPRNEDDEIPDWECSNCGQDKRITDQAFKMKCYLCG